VELVVWLAGAVLAFVLVVFGYAFGSFVLMRAHTSERTWGAAIRELTRETIVSLVTQPFLPVYYVVGRRFGVAPGGGTPVVFVHGYMQNRVGFIMLARALARRGIGPLYGINYPWFVSIASNADRLARFVEEVCKETGAKEVDLVCHSMGGLVAMEMMRKHPASVRRCVTIATPHAGVLWRGPIPGIGLSSLRRGSPLLAEHAGYTLTVPTLSVYSSHDNMVHPKETSQLALRGGRDIEVDGLAHLAILFSPEVAEHVATFLL
jgi:triacylglycerol lipase